LASSVFLPQLLVFVEVGRGSQQATIADDFNTAAVYLAPTGASPEIVHLG
jgi:hypothetical protein